MNGKIPSPFTAEQEKGLVQKAANAYYQRCLDIKLAELKDATDVGDVDKVQSAFQEANEVAGHLGYALSPETESKYVQEAYQTQLKQLVSAEEESGHSIKELKQKLRTTQEKRKKVKKKIVACKHSMLSIKTK